MENLLIYCAFGILVIALIALAATAFIFYRRITKGIAEAQKKISEYIVTLNNENAKVQERLALLEDARSGAMRFSSKGVEAREAYANRRQEAIMEGYKAYQAGMKPEEVLIEVAKKYPDVAAQYAQNPMMALTDIKKLGITLPPELLAQLAKGAIPAAKQPENFYGLQV